MEAFLTVADVRAGDHDQAREAQARLEARVRGRLRQLHPQLGRLDARPRRADAAGARRWISRQHDYLDRTGIVETWITSFSTAMCDVLEGADVVSRLRHTLDLADREGYQAEADCVLVLAYAAICADRPEEAAELVGNALHGRINATKHYAVQRGLDRALQRQLDPGSDRGRGPRPRAHPGRGAGRPWDHPVYRITSRRGRVRAIRPYRPLTTARITLTV